jgi:hypothetical protein
MTRAEILILQFRGLGYLLPSPTPSATLNETPPPLEYLLRRLNDSRSEGSEGLFRPGTGDDLGRSPTVVVAPGRRARFDVLREDPGEMALVGEPGIQGDRAQRLIGIENELLGTLNALTKQPVMGRVSDRLFECPTEMAGRQAAGARQLRQTEIARQVCAQHLLCPPFLPWRQASPVVSWPKLNGSVGLGQMRRDSPCCIISKQCVGLIRPCECREQRERKIFQYGIGARANHGAMQFRDRRATVFGSDFTKNRLRNAEIHDIKGASNVRPPGLPHVVNVHRACVESTGWFKFVITPDIISFQSFEMDTGDVRIAFRRTVRYAVTSSFSRYVRN